MDKDDVVILLQALRIRIEEARLRVQYANLGQVRSNLSIIAKHANSVATVLAEEIWPSVELRQAMGEFCRTLDECVIVCSPLAMLDAGDVQGFKEALYQLARAVDDAVNGLRAPVAQGGQS